MRRTRIPRRLPAIVESVISDHLSNPNAVFLENRATARALHLAMLLEIAPLTHRLLVAPERERQDFSRRRQALEALDRQEAVDLREQRTQSRGCVEISVLLRVLGDALEDHCNHDYSFSGSRGNRWEREPSFLRRCRGRSALRAG